jgi:ankyrin repeat protein
MHSRISWTLVLAALLAGWWADSYQPRVRSLDVGPLQRVVFVKDGRVWAQRFSPYLMPVLHTLHDRSCAAGSIPGFLSIGSQTWTYQQADSLSLGALVAGLAGMWILWRGVLYMRLRRRAKRKRCLRCAYDLSGADPAEARCPECGHRSATALRELRTAAWRALWPKTLIACALAAMILPVGSRAWHRIDRPRTLADAAMWGRVGDIDRLVREGADVNAEDSCGILPLQWAAYGWLDATQALLRHGADAKRLSSRYGDDAFLWAVESRNLTIIQALLTAGADINRVYNPTNPEARYTALTNSCGSISYGGSSETARFLLNSGADPEASGWGEVLCILARGRDDDLVRLCLERGANPNQAGRWGSVPLYYALDAANPQIVRTLLEAGADPGWGVVWLLELQRYRRYHEGKANDVVNLRLLLDHGAEINGDWLPGSPPLLVAVEAGLDEIVEVLLSRGADVYSRNEAGLNAMQVAARKGRTSTIQLLLEAGFEVDRRDRARRTALHEAANPEAAAALLGAGANINAADFRGLTPLMRAAREGMSVLSAFLLNAGADPTLIDVDGLTAAIHAERGGAHGLAETLRAAASPLADG